MKDPLQTIPGYLLSRASAAVLQRLNTALKPLGVRHVDSSILLLIASNPGMTQSEIGRVLDIQRANMVPLIARLEARGWLIRTPNGGRAQGLSLSPAGSAATTDIRAIMDQQEASLIACIPPDRRGDFVEMLRAVWGG
jgi:DNA-binding MarR family transcriptional regulator